MYRSYHHLKNLFSGKEDKQLIKTCTEKAYYNK